MRAPHHYSVGLQQISDALRGCGYFRLDARAKTLGVHRNTAWTIIKNKQGRLSAKTISRMLANPELRPSVRAVILQYLTERYDSPKILASDKSTSAGSVKPLWRKLGKTSSPRVALRTFRRRESRSLTRAERPLTPG